MASARVERLVTELTTDEKLELVGGRDLWHTHAVERLGIPSLHLSDGPSGVRGARTVGTTSVSFPCGIAVGATFDPLLAHELGLALAGEAHAKGASVLLGPTVNLHRHPLGGRHFESYSEDPHLSARLAVAYVLGLQSAGVAATVKHYVANDTEHERHTISSEVGARALRELYLAPFEAAVVEADAWAIMSAYNKINGTYAAEHAELLEGVLRGEWGFDGIVVSDWYGTQSTVASALAGLDLEMPGPPAYFGARLAEAVASGDVPIEVVDAKVRRLLELAERTGALDGPRPAAGREAEAERTAGAVAFARRLAAASFVLLRNAPTASGRPMLPLELAPGSLLAVIGPNAARTAIQGGGSARVQPAWTSSVLGGLTERYAAAGVTVEHALGCTTDRSTPPIEGEIALDYFVGRDTTGEPVATETVSSASLVWMGEPVPDHPELAPGAFSVRARSSLRATVSGPWTFSLICVGTARLLVDGMVVVDASDHRTHERGDAFYGLGCAEVPGTVELEAGGDYDVVVEYSARPGVPIAGLIAGASPPLASPAELIAEAAALAARADAVVCVVGTTGEWETEGHDRDSMDLPGLQDDLVRAVVAANSATAVLVNAGSPVTMHWAGEPAALGLIWFGGQDVGRAVADVLSGDAEFGGRLPTTLPRRLADTPAYPYYPGTGGKEPYTEGLFIGYRHYDAAGVEPRYCFGHGLSYTTFLLDDLVVSPASLDGEPALEASVTLTNSGARCGSEVVQCYVHDLERAEPGPEQELRAFAKVALEPGASTTVRLVLDRRAFAHFDEATGAFVARPGRFELRVGRSSRDLALRAEVGWPPPPAAT